MSRRRALQFACLAAIVIAIIAWFFPRSPTVAPVVSDRRAPAETPPAKVPATPVSAAPAADPAVGGESHLADDLNAPGGTIQRDLEILNELFATWQSNFPRDGNPVGENAEITAALAGENSLKFAFMARSHRAINARGDLCDRWGTPYRFHQISGRQMEIRSAGPDRKFGTEDDAVWMPPQ
ncbi:MAG: hypothetical protein EXS37_01965 [Opitutus sp.]|nr:hypothetical protein [Opitutus sp.]